MIFKPELVEKIASGRKTQTRRPVKKGEEECRYREGKPYAVQARRGGKGIFHIRITAVRQERLGDISPKDAQAEGFKTTDRFFTYWEKLYGKVDRDQPVWVLTFDRIMEEGDIFMGRRGGYTNRKHLALEPVPAVPPHVVDEVNRRRAKGLDRDAQEELRKRAARARASSLRDSEVKALNRGVDISGEVAAIDDYLAVIRAKIGEAA